MSDRVFKNFFFVFLLVFILFSVNNLYAQSGNIDGRTPVYLNQDSLFYEMTDLESMLKKSMMDGSWSLQESLIINPLFMPVLFTGKILPDNFTLYKPFEILSKPDYGLPVHTSNLFEKEIYEKEMQRKAYLYLTFHHPEAIKYIAGILPKDIPIPEEIKVNPYRDLFKIEPLPDYGNMGKPQKFIPKPRFWIANFEHSLQFSQNYISPNWYKGGNSNLNLLSYNKFQHKYEKEKVSIENKIEYKLGLYTSTSDSLRNFRIGEDIFSINSSYGYKAFSKWYYTVSLGFWTQFFNNYYENRNDLKSSSFLSPVNLNIGLGMEYKLNKKFPSDKYKKIDFTANISPFSFNYKYIYDDKVDHNRYGLTPDQKALNNFGSKINTNFTYNFNRQVSWISEFYYFTSYEKVESEFKNTLNMAINRYFSTKFFFNVRFDDGVIKKKSSDSYFQYYEILSFGFNYKW